MEADGAPSTPPASVSAPFYGFSKLLYGYTDQRKVETEVRSLKIEYNLLQLKLFCLSLGSCLALIFINRP